eukprot:COSAG01_NODE_2185_length_8205_cov_92.522576_3_plen_93_part_00
MALDLPRRWKEIAEYGPVSKCIVVVVPAFCRISEVQPCRSLSQRPRAGHLLSVGRRGGFVSWAGRSSLSHPASPVARPSPSTSNAVDRPRSW